MRFRPLVLSRLAALLAGIALVLVPLLAADPPGPAPQKEDPARVRIERGREAEYDTWHTREHVPERVSAPDFAAGRRYVDRAPPVHRYFTLYDVDSLGAFGTPQYRDLLENPPPWSAAMRPGFRNFLRVPCATARRAGFGLGAAVAVLRLALLDGAVPVSDLAAAPGLVGARLGLPVLWRSSTGLLARLLGRFVLPGPAGVCPVGQVDLVVDRDHHVDRLLASGALARDRLR